MDDKQIQAINRWLLSNPKGLKADVETAKIADELEKSEKQKAHDQRMREKKQREDKRR